MNDSAMPLLLATLAVGPIASLADEAVPNRLTPDERAAGFALLFDGESLDGWVQEGNWRVDGGAIYRSREGGFLTNGVVEMPDDFELRFEWRVAEGANSGVYYRPGQYEYQILDNIRHPDGENPRTSAASLYFGVAPAADKTRPVGEWNTARIVCKGTVVQHWLNGEKVIHLDYTKPEWAGDVARLSELGGDLRARGGRLHLQDHGDPVWFRSLRIRTLTDGDEIDPTEVTPAAVPPEMQAREQAILDARAAARRSP